MCLRIGAESLKPRGELDWQEGRGGVEKETFHKVKQNLFIFTICLGPLFFKKKKKKNYYTRQVIFIVRRRGGLRRYKSIKKFIHNSTVYTVNI